MAKFKFILLLIVSVVTGALITLFMVKKGLDWKWAQYFNEHEIFVWFAVPFVLAGMVIPVVIPIVHYIQYKRCSEPTTKTQFYRSFFSFLLAYFIMTLLKIITNRVDMEPFEPLGKGDFSGQFRFGLINGNSWWESFSEGWPSGHTMIAIAMAIAIHPLLKKRSSRILNIIYPVFIALSVSTAFHWISDVVAGALIGTVIGIYFSRYERNLSDQ